MSEKNFNSALKAAEATYVRSISETTGKIVDSFKFLDNLLMPQKPFPVLLRRKIVKAHAILLPVYTDFEKMRVDLAREAADGKTKMAFDPKNPSTEKSEFDVPQDKLKQLEEDVIKLRDVVEVIEVPHITIDEFNENPEVSPLTFVALSWLII